MRRWKHAFIAWYMILAHIPVDRWDRSFTEDRGLVLLHSTKNIKGRARSLVQRQTEGKIFSLQQQPAGRQGGRSAVRKLTQGLSCCRVDAATAAVAEKLLWDSVCRNAAADDGQQQQQQQAGAGAASPDLAALHLEATSSQHRLTQYLLHIFHYSPSWITKINLNCQRNIFHFIEKLVPSPKVFFSSDRISSVYPGIIIIIIMRAAHSLFQIFQILKCLKDPTCCAIFFKGMETFRYVKCKIHKYAKT